MIFNSPEFHALNGVEPTTYGCLTGVWKDGVFENGYSAPFAGFDIPDDTPPWRVQEMVTEAVDRSWPGGVRIKLPPPCYTPTWHAQVKALLDCGFRVERSEINQHLDGESMMSRKAHTKRQHYPCAGSFYQCAGDEEWRDSYRLLLANRVAKGRNLKLDADYVLQVRDAFPGKVEMWSMDENASALIYHVKDVALVVYWGHVKNIPGTMEVFALNLMFEYPVLDLGISTDPGLMQFKRSVGAKEGLRLDMVRGL